MRVGQVSVTLLPRAGTGFAFDIADHVRDAEPRTGTIGSGATTLEIRATGTIGGDACDTGALTLTLDRRAG